MGHILGCSNDSSVDIIVNKHDISLLGKEWEDVPGIKCKKRVEDWLPSHLEKVSSKSC